MKSIIEERKRDIENALKQLENLPKTFYSLYGYDIQKSGDFYVIVHHLNNEIKLITENEKAVVNFYINNGLFWD